MPCPEEQISGFVPTKLVSKSQSRRKFAGRKTSNFIRMERIMENFEEFQ
ncbi:hypothetical protein B4135_2649 [Caldibacillus debilis]|uniref:Uncharacterized protein n=1 Tax=Caldibacillus debilis TaxID=301148 RepID=A0A150LV39_9BACI|nr:hypothetical protein B4135_2649 [Caldibacillus debilis]